MKELQKPKSVDKSANKINIEGKNNSNLSSNESRSRQLSQKPDPSDRSASNHSNQSHHSYHSAISKQSSKAKAQFTNPYLETKYKEKSKKKLPTKLEAKLESKLLNKFGGHINIEPTSNNSSVRSSLRSSYQDSSNRSSVNSHSRDNSRESSQRSKYSDVSERAYKMNSSHESTLNDPTISTANKTISRSNSRNNSRIRLASLSEDEEVELEESTSSVDLRKGHSPTQKSQDRLQVHRRPGKDPQPKPTVNNYSVNEVKLPTEMPPKRHKASRPKLLKFIESKNTKGESPTNQSVFKPPESKERKESRDRQNNVQNTQVYNINYNDKDKIRRRKVSGHNEQILVNHKPKVDARQPPTTHDSRQHSRDQSRESCNPRNAELARDPSREKKNKLMTQTLEHDENFFEALRFIKTIPKLDLFERPKRTIPARDPDDSRPTLVLDLDETLVHSSIEPQPNPDDVFLIEMNENRQTIQVKQRPFMRQFLKWCRKHFEVVIYTASQKLYADTLLNRLDRENRLFDYRLFRDSCVNFQGCQLKDIECVNRSMAQTFLVDNSPQAFGFHVENGVPIKSQQGDPLDSELIKLMKVLEEMLQVSDVRNQINDHFKLKEMISRINM